MDDNIIPKINNNLSLQRKELLTALFPSDGWSIECLTFPLQWRELLAAFFPSDGGVRGGYDLFFSRLPWKFNIGDKSIMQCRCFSISYNKFSKLIYVWKYGFYHQLIKQLPSEDKIINKICDSLNVFSEFIYAWELIQL